MKYSILLTAFDPDKKLVDMTNGCIEKIKQLTSGDYELIVLDQKGIAKALNEGIKQATGDCLIHLANDIILLDHGWNEQLYVPHAISSYKLTPSFDNKPEPNFACCAIPKYIQEKIGFFDEQFDGLCGYDDTDFMYRARLLGIEFQEKPIGLKHQTTVETQTAFYYYGNTRLHTIVVARDLFYKKHNLLKH